VHKKVKPYFAVQYDLTAERSPLNAFAIALP
jgi:hypothetical protein